jgi:hypothetical protein
MNPIAALHLDRARPSDRIHLLGLQHPEQINPIAQHYNAHRIDYRQNLHNRLKPSTKFLSLQNHLDRELQAIQTATQNTPQNHPIAILEHFDLAIAYYQSRPGYTLKPLWVSLENLRKLPVPLWITLPIRQIPETWNRDRKQLLHPDQP